MITCPTCGAQNDPANRFCDQCGSRLEPAASTAPTVSADAQSTVVATTTCPSCGAAVLPGEAFCDTCGAPLPANTSATTASNDAPTMLAAPVDGATPVGTPVAADSAGGVICPVCGHQNMPGDKFCDNCGADLTAPASIASNDAPTVLAEAVSPDPVTAPPPAVPPPANEAPAETPVSTEPVTMLPEDAILPAATDVAVTQPSGVTSAPSDAATQANGTTQAPSDATTTATGGDSSAEHQRLEEVIATQQKVVAQLEQTQSALGAATPDAIVQALQGARDTLAQAESDLASLAPPAPAVDPAEVARLEEAVATQQKVVDQLQQTQAALGAATPAAILQALQDAQAALDQSQNDLQALTGSASARTSTGASPSTQETPSTADVQAASATQETAPAGADQAAPSEAPPTQPPATPAPAPSPRLVMVEGGNEVSLPTDKAEIVIGREDPISQIFPEVDLTPYGGESGGVSRQHARLNHQNGQWTVTDLNSTNYTRVDGAKIDPNTPVPIQDGARLQFGRIAAVFHA